MSSTGKSATGIDLKKMSMLGPSEHHHRKHKNTPESSQTDSDDVSPQVQRKRKTGHTRDSIPRFSISIEDDREEPKSPSASFLMDQRRKENSFELADAISKHRSRSIVKSASDLGLSLLMRSENAAHLSFGAGGGQGVAPVNVKNVVNIGGNGGSSSTASSRDTSPCRDLSPLVTNLKPPIVIRRGPRGFGFTVHTIRVYYGDTDFYTMHHLVMAVEEGSPAFEAGLRPADLITHVNGEPVQGLYHTQVLQLLLSCSEQVMIRATPLTNTSIQSGGRKRDLGQSKLAKRSVVARNRKKKDNEKKRKTSLFRRISSKRANAEIQQLTAGLTTPTNGPSPSLNFVGAGNRLNFIPFDSASSQSSSPNSSVPNTPTGSCGSVIGAGGPPHLYQRPSSLHGLKHKLQTTKTLHASNTPTTPNRRKSVAHIPLSPLARTPSPTRSPSPLAFPTGHHPGSSNTTQSYSPTVGNSNNNSGTNLNISGGSGNSSQSGSPQVLTGTAIINPNIAGVAVNTNPSNCIVTRRSFSRPKSAEHNNSPLLRRALSPDRPLIRAMDNKCNFVSPLCGQPVNSTASNTVVNSTPTITTSLSSSTTSGIWRSPSATSIIPSSGAGGHSPFITPPVTKNLPPLSPKASFEEPTPLPTAPVTIISAKKEDLPPLALTIQTSGEFLPRIAEEKDSPTSGVSEIMPLIGDTQLPPHPPAKPQKTQDKAGGSKTQTTAVIKTVVTDSKTDQGSGGRRSSNPKLNPKPSK